MRSTTAIRADMSAAADEAQALVASRKSTSAVRGGLDRLEAKMTGLGEELKNAEHREGQHARFAAVGGPGGLGEIGGGRSFKARATDRLAPDESLASWCDTKGLTGTTPRGTELSFDRMMKGIATGEWGGAEAELKALGEGTPAAGGYLVPTPLSSQVLDLARNAARVFQAGATTVPMTSQTLRIARQITDPALAWHTEAATITPSNVTFDSVTLTAQTLPCLIKISLELFEDAPNASGVISNAVARALALELDRVALRGSGTAPEPRGIRNTTGVTVQSMGTNGATPTNFDLFATAIETVRSANFEPNAVLYSPRTAGTMSRLKDSTGQPLRQPDDVGALTKFPTNQVPNNITQGTATTASDSYVAQWSELMIGMRTTFTIKPLYEKFIDTGEFGFFAYLRADVALAHPAAFVVVEGILP